MYISSLDKTRSRKSASLEVMSSQNSYVSLCLHRRCNLFQSSQYISQRISLTVFILFTLPKPHPKFASIPLAFIIIQYMICISPRIYRNTFHLFSTLDRAVEQITRFRSFPLWFRTASFWDIKNHTLPRARE